MSCATDSMSATPNQPSVNQFAHVAQAHVGAKHAVGIDANGTAYSCGSNNVMGQLGRNKGRLSKPFPVLVVPQDAAIRFSRAYAGGSSESGHSAILDTSRTRLYMAGCDRWQQLGLGSSSGGASGYTWTDGGRIWRNEFVLSKHLHEFMNETSGTNKIRDVALGCDHTVVLSDNQPDVYTFGKGGEGQLGVVGKPFVSAPIRSPKLSSKSLSIAAVCAIQHCSLTIDGRGNVMNEAGKCRRTPDMMESLQTCIRRAEKDGLLHPRTTEES